MQAEHHFLRFVYFSYIVFTIIMKVIFMNYLEKRYAAVNSAFKNFDLL